MNGFYARESVSTMTNEHPSLSFPVHMESTQTQQQLQNTLRYATAVENNILNGNHITSTTTNNKPNGTTAQLGRKVPVTVANSRQRRSEPLYGSHRGSLEHTNEGKSSFQLNGIQYQLDDCDELLKNFDNNIVLDGRFTDHPSNFKDLNSIPQKNYVNQKTNAFNSDSCDTSAANCNHLDVSSLVEERYSHSRTDNSTSSFSNKRTLDLAAGTESSHTDRKPVNRNSSLLMSKTVIRRGSKVDNKNLGYSIPLEESYETNNSIHANNPKLVPLEINFLSNENRELHHTNDYDFDLLILRRGQKFLMTVRFDQAFDPQSCLLTLQFTLGNQSIISKCTHIRVPVDESSCAPVSGWTANFIQNDSEQAYSKNIVKVEVCTSPNALIGRYNVYLETKMKHQNPCLFKYADDVPIIANPFCDHDQCYMSEENDLNEYLLNEDGIIFLGTKEIAVARPWYFGQFQHPCLDIALWLLDRANLPWESRGSIYHVVRALAAMVNGGDRGMIESFKTPAAPQPRQSQSNTLTPHGKSQQQQQQQSGFDPNEWIGSVKIIKKFMEFRGQPVRYGSSWTYSAVLCTLVRSIGIPCRVVTGYNTCHDCDLNTTIDFHWDRNHRPVVQLNRDTIKTNHCWNEMWFSRDDIPTDFNGWQAVDCTCSTASECMYRLGPCSVKSILEDKCSYISDGPMFLSMIKGYVVHWIAKRNGDMMPFALDEKCLAPSIVTKSVGSSQPVHITSSYKNTDSQLSSSSLSSLNSYNWDNCSGGMRSALERRKNCIRELISKANIEEDVLIETEMVQESTYGDTIVLRWSIQNTSSNRRTCQFYMHSYFATADGKLLSSCKDQHHGDVVTLESGKHTVYYMKIRAEDYMDRIKPYHLIRIYAMLFVKETRQAKPLHFDFSFESYKMIKILDNHDAVSSDCGRSISATLVDGKIPIKIQIANPLKRILRNCTLHIEGIGSPRTIILERPLRPLEVTVYQTTLVPNRIGLRTLYIGFSCAILNNIIFTAPVNIVSPGYGDESASSLLDGDDDLSTIEIKNDDVDQRNNNGMIDKHFV